MPTNLPPVLLQAPLVERDTLLVSRPWLGWFQASYLRQGGESSATNSELAGGVLLNAGHIGQVENDLASTSTDLAALEGEVTVLQQTVVQLQTDLTALTERVTLLEATTTDQATRLAALEAWRTALVAALPAVVTVTNVPALGDAPSTADVLRDDLTANWQGTLNTNDSDLATMANGLRDALAA